MSITLIVFGHHWGGRDGLLLALVAVLGTNSYIYFNEDRRLLSRFGGRLAEGQDSWGLGEMVRRLSIKARIGIPQLVILDEAAPQAAVVGRNVSKGTLILTEGLIKKLSRAELEAVVAFQIASIRALNTLTYSIASFLASICFFVTETLDLFVRILIVEKKNKFSPVTQIFTRASSPIVGFILRFCVRPSFYLAADQIASQLLGDQKDLARALWKLQSYANTTPFHSPLSAAHIFIISPLSEQRWTRLLATQPSSAVRIKKLIGYFPI
jgi:heat shock protein HtpX